MKEKTPVTKINLRGNLENKDFAEQSRKNSWNDTA